MVVEDDRIVLNWSSACWAGDGSETACCNAPKTSGDGAVNACACCPDQAQHERNESTRVEDNSLGLDVDILPLILARNVKRLGWNYFDEKLASVERCEV